MSKFTPKAQSKQRGIWWILYGVAGVGKTEQVLKLYGVDKTFLINLELGADHVEDEHGNKPIGIGRDDKDDEGNLLLPDLNSIYALIEWLKTQNYRAVAVDSLTVLCNYIFGHVNNKKFEYASEGGWDNKNKAVEESAKLAKAFQSLQDAGIDILMTAHSKMSSYNDPMEEKPYDRFIVDTPHDPIAQVFVRLANNVGFCHYENEKRSETTKKAKMDSNGERVILFENRPYATDCKNRSGLGAFVPMDKEANGIRAALAAASSNKGKTPAQIKEEIRSLIARATNAAAKQGAMIALDKAGENVAELARIKEKLSTAVGA